MSYSYIASLPRGIVQERVKTEYVVIVVGHSPNMQLFRHIMTGALVLLLVVPEVEGNWFQDLFNGFKDGVKNIAKRIGDGVKTVTKGIGKGVKKVVTGIQDVAKKVGVAVKGAAKGIARKGCKVGLICLSVKL